MQLCKLLLRVWEIRTAVSRLENCGTAVTVAEGKAYLLESSDGDVSILYP